MRRLLVLIAAVVFGSLAIVGVSTHSARASSSYSWIETTGSSNNINDQNGPFCITDEGDYPPNNNQMVLDVCSQNAEAQWFTATPSSYGSGWYSIVNQNRSYGSYCLEDTGGYNNSEIILAGCNGTRYQAYKMVCVYQNQENPRQFTFPELEDAAGYALNDYGGYDGAGDHVVSWTFESPAPYSLLWYGPNGIPGSCSFGF